MFLAHSGLGAILGDDSQRALAATVTSLSGPTDGCNTDYWHDT